MEKILRKLKTDLNELSTKNNFKIKHISNKFQDILEYWYYYSINRKKRFLVFRFVYQKQEESLSLIYHYEYNSKAKTINETHSLANYEIDSLPGIKETDKDLIKDIYKFAVDDNSIKNKIDLEKQFNLIFKIFNNNYKEIIKYVETIK